MDVRIVPYTETPKNRQAFREIFFVSSSRQQFASDEEKENFFARWTSYYFLHEPQLIFLVVDSKDNVLGYLTGCADSVKAKPILTLANSRYPLFEDQFSRFPAHLHINCSPAARGQGVGSKLISHFVNVLSRPGVHLVTSPGMRNVQFYQRNGFTYELTRHWNESPLLFMGR